MALETENKYVLFKLDNEDYGLNIDSVLSIEKFQSCTRVPNALNTLLESLIYGEKSYLF